MSEKGYITVMELLEGRNIYLIPDYQRGYSWDAKNLKDFWDDLIRILNSKQLTQKHYLGVISIKAFDIIKEPSQIHDMEAGYKFFYIVDGQQRFTTIIILLNEILNLEIKVDSVSNEENKKNFLFRKTDDRTTYKFGYESDDPSYDYFKSEIMPIPDGWPGYKENNDLKTKHNTLYIKRLQEAKDFFKGELGKIEETEVANGEVESREKKIQNIFNALTQRMVCVRNILDESLNIFMIFETMNSRGKPVSNLELVKNRLMYLSTLIEIPNEDKGFRETCINYTWKIIYKYLGFMEGDEEKEDSGQDDYFLRNHWIMFNRYNRSEEDFFKTDILDKVFIIQNINSKNKETEVDYKKIKEYVDSLRSSIGQWYVFHYPYSDKTKDLLEKSSTIPESEEGLILATLKDKWDLIAYWLDKNNRIGFRYFEPLLLGVFLKENNSEEIIDLLQLIERFLFLSFYLSMRRANYGSSKFSIIAQQYYNQIDNTDLKAIKNAVSDWIEYPDNSKKYDTDSFTVYMKDKFVSDLNFGFRNWSGAKYFFEEYEIRNLTSDKKTLSKKQFIDYIIPFSKKYIKPESADPKSEIQTFYEYYESKIEWNKYSQPQIKMILCSLGNLVLSNRELPKEKKDFKERLDLAGTKSSLEILNSEHGWVEDNNWTPNSILKRGLYLLEFMERTWNIYLGKDEDKKKLLFLDFIKK